MTDRIAAMTPKLAIIKGDTENQDLYLKTLPITLGRAPHPHVDLTILHPAVSRRHCEVYEKDGKLFVKDLGSANGTFLNDHERVKDHPIEPGDSLTVGPVTFVVLYKKFEPSSTSELAAIVDKIASEKVKTGSEELPDEISPEDSSPFDLMDSDAVHTPYPNERRTLIQTSKTVSEETTDEADLDEDDEDRIVAQLQSGGVSSLFDTAVVSPLEVDDDDDQQKTYIDSSSSFVVQKSGLDKGGKKTSHETIFDLLVQANQISRQLQECTRKIATNLSEDIKQLETIRTIQDEHQNVQEQLIAVRQKLRTLL